MSSPKIAPANEHFMIAFEDVKSMGYKYSIPSKKPRETQTGFHYALNLNPRLRLILKEFGPKGDNKYYFFITKTLPEGITIEYYNFTTNIFVSDCILYNVKIEEGLLTFNINEKDFEKVSKLKVFNQIAKVKDVHEKMTKCAAEYDFVGSIPTQLYRYTDNEVILEYFKNNSLVGKVAAPHNTQQFVDI